MIKTLICCYGPKLSVGDERIERILQAIEAATGQNLDYHIPRYVKPRKLSVSRTDYISRWLAESSDHSPEPINNGKLFGAMLMASLMNENDILIDAKHQSYGKTELECLAPEPEYYEAANACFLQISAAARAFEAVHWSVKSAEQRGYTKENFHFLIQQADNNPTGRSRPLVEKKRDLYKYELSSRTIIGLAPDGNRIRVSLGWVNYWCDTIADSLKFPDSVRDKPLVGLYERVGGHGWLVRITAEPLDFDNPEHLARMQWAYDRFGIA